MSLQQLYAGGHFPLLGRVRALREKRRGREGSAPPRRTGEEGQFWQAGEVADGLKMFSLSSTVQPQVGPHPVSFSVPALLRFVCHLRFLEAVSCKGS